MANIAIVTDSNSGITQKEAKETGVFVLPMPFMIGERTYYEEMDLTHEIFYAKMAEDTKISTSQPSPEDVTGLWDKLLQTYDEIVHIPMSSALSGSCQTARLLAQDYDGRVAVVDNQRISVTQRRSVWDALSLSRQGMNAAQIQECLEKDKLHASIYIMPDTLTYLKRGGRITPAAAALGNILRLKPVLQIQGEKLDAFARARTAAQGKSVMLSAIRNDIEERFGGRHENVWLYVAHSNNKAGAEAFREEAAFVFSGAQIEIQELALSIGCHTGPGALAFACAQKLHC